MSSNGWMNKELTLYWLKTVWGWMNKELTLYWLKTVWGWMNKELTLYWLKTVWGQLAFNRDRCQLDQAGMGLPQTRDDTENL